LTKMSERVQNDFAHCECGETNIFLTRAHGIHYYLLF